MALPFPPQPDDQEALADRLRDIEALVDAALSRLDERALLNALLERVKTCSRPTLDGAPSVLFDAVAIMAAPEGARALAANPAARDFVSDAYAHCKFIGYTSGAAPLLEAAGLRSDPAPDDGFISLDDHKAADLISRCRQLRFWDRLRAAVT